MKNRKIKIRDVNQSAYDNLKEYPELLRKLYASRGIESQADLDYHLKNMLKPEKLFNIHEAAKALADAIESDSKLLVIGDFDADGATSTSVAVTALKSLGAKHIDYLVPNRFEFGYGLSEAIVEVAHQQFNPDWIITVDNGIANHDGVKKAHALGIKVLITDHHLPGETIPDADVIVNPNLPQCEFPSKALAGVGVIYYVMLALRAELDKRNYFENYPKPNMAELLDLVALGTVADLVPLDKINRLLVAQGMQRMRKGMHRQGLKALFEVAGIEEAKLTTRDLGFGLGPRLNAAGRLDDMSLGIACLLETDPLLAKQKAQTLNELNEKRKQIESDMKESAFGDLDHLFDEDKIPHGICVYDKSWHQGVIGILAGRIKDKYLRPTIVFAADDELTLKGSARSVPGLHIRDLLAEINANAPHIIKKFGGHAMAAGLSIELKYFDEFNDLFNQYISNALTIADLEGELLCDGPLSEQDITLQTVNMLEAAGPWGQAFPPPKFCNQFELVQVRVVGEKHLKLKARMNPRGKVFDAIWFNPSIDLDLLESGDPVEMIYDVNLNEFQNRISVQLMVEHINQCQTLVPDTVHG